MPYTAERILRAAVQSMITGHHAPYCFSTHIVGQGYVNNGTPRGEVLPERIAESRADYLRQLKRTATSEIENIGYATGYAEPGYTQPVHGVFFANWNHLPSDVQDILERAGYAVEWSDEWTTCEDCQRAYRTLPDSYCWTPSGQFIEGSRDYSDPYQSDTVELCLDCLQEWAESCRQSDLGNIADAADNAIAAHSNEWMYRDVEES